MPPVNVYYRNAAHEQALIDATDPLRDCVARLLSTSERSLVRDEVSVRILKSLGQGMLADIEMDIAAASNPSRIQKQDEICGSVRDFIVSQVPDLADAKVWLSLHELGYSFD